MTEIMLSNEAMQYINTVSKIIHIDILDCVITGDRIIFIVRKGQLGAAIGSKAKNLEKLRKLLNKNIKFVEYDDDKKRFLRNLFKPYRINDLEIDDQDPPVAKVKVDPSAKSKVIGRGGRNIELIRRLAQRHHAIKDVQIK